MDHIITGLCFISALSWAWATYKILRNTYAYNRLSVGFAFFVCASAAFQVVYERLR